MIDSRSESILTLSQACDELPRRRRGQKTHVSTLYRWATVGCRGIRLETLQVGGTACTSREALQRFFERLTLARAGVEGQTPPPASISARTASRRLRDAELAGRKLESLGA